jgi:hypothetical protein
MEILGCFMVKRVVSDRNCLFQSLALLQEYNEGQYITEERSLGVSV